MFLCNWLRKIFSCNQVPIVGKCESKEPRVENEETKVEESERIVRFLLSPLHFKDGQLRPNAFNPTIGTDEVSVNRLEILPIDQTKHIAKSMAANHPNDHKYCGFALHTKHSAIECGAKDVVPDRLENNEAHAELKLGVVRKNQDLPPQLQEIKDNLVEGCKLLRDPNPDEDGWSGDEPIYS